MLVDSFLEETEQQYKVYCTKRHARTAGPVDRVDIIKLGKADEEIRHMYF